MASKYCTNIVGRAQVPIWHGPGHVRAPMHTIHTKYIMRTRTRNTCLRVNMPERAVMNMPARYGRQALGQGEDLPGQWHGRRTWNKINAA